MERLVRDTEAARNWLGSELRARPRYPTGNRSAAPQSPGVYIVFEGHEIVYVGSAGHGQNPKRGIRRRLYRQFTRTYLSAVRQGIALELGREDYRPRNKAEKDQVLEARIDERLAGLTFTFVQTDTGRIAMRFERLATALLEPRFNRQ